MYYYKNMKTPIGALTILCDDESLVALDFDFNGEGIDKTEYRLDPGHRLCVQVEQELTEYFLGERTTFSVPMKLAGTDFQMQVWEALKKIPYGAVKSYQDIAIEINRPLAVRAVGQANRRNPMPIIIPCHRVIGKNNDLVGYAGNKVGMKEQLLKLEGAIL